MSLIDSIKDELLDMETLHMIAMSFTDAAAMRIRSIRKKFEENKAFYDELSHVYHLVKIYAINKGIISDITRVMHPLRVAFTSNQHFYGNIHWMIMEKILKDQAIHGGDLLIIGNTGREYAKSAGIRDGFRYMHVHQDSLSHEEIAEFLDQTASYMSILVYYPRFVTLVRQEVGVIDIAQAKEIDGDIVEESERAIIFEPEIEEMLAFFDRQIRAVLFRRVLLESNLARTAARMVAMNDASEKAKDMVKEKQAEYLTMLRSRINRQLLDTFSSITLWNESSSS